MVSKGAVISIVVILVLASAFSFVYFYFEKPQKEKAEENSEVNIRIHENDEAIRTGYKMYDSRTLLVGKGNTTSLGSGFVSEKVAANKSVRVENVNTHNQNFYKSRSKAKKTSESEPIRFNLEVERPGSIHLSKGRPLSNDKNSTSFEIYGNNLIKNVHFCVEWSVNLVDVTSNFTEASVPPYFENYDKCFETEETLDDSELNVSLNYEYWGYLEDSDYIRIGVYDADSGISENKISHTELQNGTIRDIGAENEEINITTRKFG